MKRLFKLGTLSLVVALLVTGCGMKAEYGINIAKDKTVSLEFIVAQDNEMIDAMLNMGNSDEDSDNNSNNQKTYTDEERWKYLESSNEESDDFKDFKKEKYDKDGYKGYIYKLDLGNIDQLVADTNAKTDFESINKEAKIFSKKGDTYSINLKTSDQNSAQMEQYKDSVNFDVKLVVTLPNKAKSNNATSVKGNTYTWDLTKAKSIELEFVFGSSDNNIVLYVGISILVIGALAVLFIILNKKKKKD